MKKIMIAGTSSGSGKTTITLGIMSAISRKNYKVCPFKTGPDYIDPGFHKYVTGNPSYNLDTWMLEENTVKYLFEKNSVNFDISVIEGVMGFYDGFGVESNIGSSAHLSKILNVPVILIIDGQAMSSSAAAIALGFKVFDPEVNIAGIIVNKVSGESHYELISRAIELKTGIPCVGYLPSDTNLSLDSRHLGLIPAEELEDLNKKVDILTNLVEKHIDLDKIISISETKSTSTAPVPVQIKELLKNNFNLKIGVARDKAFSFYYEDNLKLLEELGVKLVPFSPLNDEKLPDDLDGLYIGGGFPETFAGELEKNLSFRNDLKNKLENGLPAYAECGGLMYLTQKITVLDGKSFEMVGFIPADSVMTKKLQRFGYINLSIENKLDIKAHEFHHSCLEHDNDVNYIYIVSKSREGNIVKTWKCGARKKNVLAGYAHIHFYSNPDFLKLLLENI